MGKEHAQWKINQSLPLKRKRAISEGSSVTLLDDRSVAKTDAVPWKIRTLPDLAIANH
jgi:hypothetical protein